MGKCYPDAFLWTGSQFGEVKTTVWQCNKGLQGNTISRPAVPYHPSPACLLSQSQSCHRVLACHSDDSDSSGTVYFCLPSSTAETYLNRNGIARKSRSLSKLKTKSFTNRYLDIYPFSILLVDKGKRAFSLFSNCCQILQTLQIQVFFFGIPFAVGSLFCLPSD